MEFKFISNTQINESEKEKIWSLLKECDNDFVPPLSSRESTFKKIPQGNNKNYENEDGPHLYFNELLKGCFLLGYTDNEFAGFLAYLPDHITKLDLCGDVKAHYLTTLIISPKYRGMGFAGKFYEEISKKYECKDLCLRTWSTNKAQMHTVKKYGYEPFFEIKNDRGEGIDTIYFIKKSKSESE